MTTDSHLAASSASAEAPPSTPATLSGLLSGRTGWIITDGKAGMLVQAQGVADALGLKSESKIVALEGLMKLTAPWGGVSRRLRFGEAGSPLAPPWPDVAIATGRASIPFIRAIKRAAGPAVFTVVLQDPKTGPGTADLIWVPQHDRRRGANVLTTLTAPHGFTARRLASLRAVMPPEIAALPGPRIAVVLGGKNGVYKFRDEDDDRLASALASLAALGASFMITPSRRTHDRLMRAAEAATRRAPRLIWDGTGANPYADFLAHADALVVTADSVNMTGECCATGRPVYVFTPSGGSPKFSRFHKALESIGATRALPATLDQLPDWRYTALDSTGIIAAEIERRWARRSEMLGGIVSPASRGSAA
ncbi:MAG: mitochondrial fission ELM1 family protein [Hyphomicrobium sp.]|nr:mitochondrial fission ELM1 family protein [Hyphomicrobium sp.]